MAFWNGNVNNSYKHTPAKEWKAQTELDGNDPGMTLTGAHGGQGYGYEGQAQGAGIKRAQPGANGAKVSRIPVFKSAHKATGSRVTYNATYNSNSATSSYDNGTSNASYTSSSSSSSSTRAYSASSTSSSLSHSGHYAKVTYQQGEQRSYYQGETPGEGQVTCYQQSEVRSVLTYVDSQQNQVGYQQGAQVSYPAAPLHGGLHAAPHHGGKLSFSTFHKPKTHTKPHVSTRALGTYKSSVFKH